MKNLQIFTTLLLATTMTLGSCSKEGPQGPKGDKGTANVIYSDWFNVKFALNASIWSANFNVPKLTKDIVDHGNVVVFVKSESGDVYKVNDVFDDHYIELHFNVGIVYLVSDFDASYPYRYILIPGGTHARLTGGQARTSTPYPDLNDYYAVCQYYGIPE